MKLAIRGHDLGKKGEFDLKSELMRYGFDGVQLVPHKTFSDYPYSPEISSEKAAATGKEFADAKLEIFLLGAYFNPVHSNAGKVKLGVDVFKRYLELSKAFGCGYVGSETGSFNDDKWTYNPLNRTDDALRTVVETFSGLKDKADEVGSAVAMEGAAGHVCFCPERLKEAVDSIGGNIGIIFDLYNYLDESNYADYKSILCKGFDLFDGKILLFHMKDFSVEEGKIKQCAVGKGVIDYEWLIGAIKDYDKNAKLVLEGTTGSSIAPSAELIRTLWNK